MQIKVITRRSQETFQNEVNNFIAHKFVLDIKYDTNLIDNCDETTIIYTAFIEYEESATEDEESKCCKECHIDNLF